MFLPIAMTWSRGWRPLATWRRPTALIWLRSNSGSLPLAPDDVLERYRAAVTAAPGGDPALGDWDAQVDLTWIVGLLLRGWRKGLDAEDEVTLPSGMTAGDDLALWCRMAVDAAERRLPG